MRDDPTDYRIAVLPEQEEAHAAWIEKARAAARELAGKLGTITSDHIWEACPPPGGTDPRVLGAVFSDRAVWEKVGYVKSGRKINHGRPVAEWRLREAVAA